MTKGQCDQIQALIARRAMAEKTLKDINDQIDRFPCDHYLPDGKYARNEYGWCSLCTRPVRPKIV